MQRTSIHARRGGQRPLRSKTYSKSKGNCGGVVYVIHNGGAILMREAATPQKAYTGITAKDKAGVASARKAAADHLRRGKLLSALP